MSTKDDLLKLLGLAILVGLVAGTAVALVGSALGLSGAVLGGATGGIVGAVVAGLRVRQKKERQ